MVSFGNASGPVPPFELTQLRGITLHHAAVGSRRIRRRARSLDGERGRPVRHGHARADQDQRQSHLCVEGCGAGAPRSRGANHDGLNRFVAVSGARKAKAKGTANSTIDLYFWTTPNGYKIPIMLEECGLPYRSPPDRHQQRRSVQAGLSRHLPQQQDSAIVDQDGPGRKADLDFRIRGHSSISRPQDGRRVSARRARRA